MKPEIKVQWTAALRSGEYEQTTQRLHDDVGYCCLGVLCDLHAKATGQEWEPGESSITYLRVDDVLPYPVAFWAGLSSTQPHIGEYTLDQLNDGDRELGLTGHTFAEIADLIDQHL